ncbi:5'-3' exoribonuclease 1 isoform X2 [Drosophila obscura]|uniref:5'-3' exoribonuclease 1 isoform X2 n=1 Tax=Drosophila obscura TaxID=7282 RepID=UPI001BB23AF7|nr:5'-3' exoribonuclease 1 isoform X2 [Drosophila obscura]
MGVPKFFRYISERYPCLSELAREHSIPEFDNLYLDMNGIVHNCSHPDDNNIHFHMEEQQIFQEIFNYVDKLFYLIKPQKLFFLAVDGVAPRAKMNQQRSRRFRSAREAELLEAKALQRGDRREHERFDSNCITPGTDFMERLQQGLRCFLKTKISTDPLWQKCSVILSGQETPGEGEHKIMDYIRYMKAQPNFDPNTRHCLYGLDADLIILGLCTHELHFVVLREEVKFGRNVKRASVEETRFFLLHLGLLREYLELEFHELTTAQQKLDVAQLIDDWVLMGFMVGNDFIPHLPCLHISSNALPLLYKTYIRIYHSLGGNINEHGKLNLQRLQTFMTALSEVELDQYKEHADELKYTNSNTEAFDIDIREISSSKNYDSDLEALIDDSIKLYKDDSDEDLSDEEGGVIKEFQNYKRNYYRNKFNLNSRGQNQLIEELGHHYVTALQWILDYYYRGVQSWDWYYPFHYAPFISDLSNIETVQIKFQLGTPFLPFEQLLAVLPAASFKLLPAAYHDLMLNPTSPLAEFYPTEFKSDLNGKKHDWEAVVLIPFIDESLLLSAMLPCEAQLSPVERARNRHGPMYQYDYSPHDVGSMAALPPLKALQHVNCTEVARWAEEIALNLSHSVCVEMPNAARHVFFPGFPTMKHLAFNFELRHGRVKVFEQVSRNQNMVLMPRKQAIDDSLEAIAARYLEQVVHIGWPHLIMAKVVKVATRSQCIDKEGKSSNESRRFDMECKTLKEHFSTRMGIQFDNYDVLVYVRTYAGSSVDFGAKGTVHMKDAWSSSITEYPAQGVVGELSVQKNMRQQFSKIEQLFPSGCLVFFIGSPYHGSEGTVLDPLLVYSCGRIQVNIRVHPEPNLEEARLEQEERDKDYMNTFDVCRQLNINGRALGRLTGTFWVVLGPRREKMENVAKHNIGLQLKYPRQNEERVGYCRRSNNQWFYSSLALELMQRYCERFPEVVSYFGVSNDRNEYFFEQDIYPDAMGQHNIEDLANWVRQQQHMKVDRIACGSKTVCKETVELLIGAAEELRSMPVKDVKLQVKPHLLIKPNVTLPEVYKSRRPARLFDRVIIVRTIYMVPVGIKGTIIGVHPVSDPNPVRLECVHAIDTFCEVLFDKCVPNCNDIHGIAEERVYKIPENALVVICSNENGQNQQSGLQFEKRRQSYLSNQTNSPRIEKREQQNWQPQKQQQTKKEQQKPPATSSRYVTAAGSNWNQITMKTQIADEFVKPQSDLPLRSNQHLSKCYTTNRGRSTLPTKSQTEVAKESCGQSSTRLQGGSVCADPKPTNISPAIATPQEQTLALMSLLGLNKEQDTLQQPLGHVTRISSQQQQQPLISKSQILQQPLSGQMPKLPQPPLFWQKEAQQQKQQAQQANRIQTQQWFRSMQPPEMPPHIYQLTYNGNQPCYNNTLGHEVYSNPRTTLEQKQYQTQHPQQLQDISTRPRYSSIQDFVPTQAYRPKISQRPQRIVQIDAEMPSLTSAGDVNSRASHREAVPNEGTSTLKQILNTEPSTSQAKCSTILAAKVGEDPGAGAESTAAQLKMRKQRVPRIGAKFDLDYIIH